MPPGTSRVSLHNFPSNFQPDTPYLKLALAEYNLEQGRALSFAQLDRQARREVLRRAQQLKAEA